MGKWAIYIFWATLDQFNFSEGVTYNSPKYRPHTFTINPNKKKKIKKKFRVWEGHGITWSLD